MSHKDKDPKCQDVVTRLEVLRSDHTPQSVPWHTLQDAEHEIVCLRRALSQARDDLGTCRIVMEHHTGTLMATWPRWVKGEFIISQIDIDRILADPDRVIMDNTDDDN